MQLQILWLASQFLNQASGRAQPSQLRHLPLRLRGPAGAGQREAEVVTGLRVIGLLSQYLLQQGESFAQAVQREALEELGLDVRIECILGTTHFYRGATLPEHEMVGVHYGCSIPDAMHMRLSDEHCASQWVTGEQAQALFPAGHWLRALIARAEVVRRLIPHELCQFYHQEGFEI